MSPTRNKSAARDRILETAGRLFYQDGIRAVGIDRVIAEAGVAKMTLYNHFKSKDDLILAVLTEREKFIDALFRASIAKHEKRGKDPVRAFFAALRDWFKGPDFRGCAFINATAELADADHPGSRFSKAHKKKFVALLAESLDAFGGAKAKAQAPAIALLVEGAIVVAQMNGSPAAADVARDAAIRLLKARP